MNVKRGAIWFVTTMFLLFMNTFAGPAFANTFSITERVNLSTAGDQTNNWSFTTSISRDGRSVAFMSGADNLVPNDNNFWEDAFVRDRQTDMTDRANISTGGQESQDFTWDMFMNDSGRHVVFASEDSNLVVGDTNGFSDIFIRDRQTGVTERVSVSSQGAETNDWSEDPAVSSTGQFVAFMSYANNLVPSDNNNAGDIFARDRQTGVTERVSVGVSGNESNGHSSAVAIDSSGRYVAFQSGASNLVAGDNNGQVDIFVYDRQTGATERVSVSSQGAEADLTSFSSAPPEISAGGRFVVFASFATNLVVGVNDNNSLRDVFIRDRQTGTTELVSVASDGSSTGDDQSEAPSVSADGRYVVFKTYADNLVANDDGNFYKVVVRDRETGLTEQFVVGYGGEPANGASGGPPSISGDGRTIAFTSQASNLVPNDTNGTWDVFVAEQVTGNTSQGSGAATVTVSLANNVEISFDDITATGDTTCVIGNPVSSAPAGFTFLGSQYDISTTAGYAGSIRVTVPYDESLVPGDEDDLEIFHWNGSSWEDLTVSVDTINNTITGQTNSLSPFAVGGPAPATGLNVVQMSLLALLAIVLGSAMFVFRSRSDLRI